MQLKTFIKDVKDFDFPTENKKFIKLLKERTVSGHSEDSQSLDYGQARLAGMAKVVKKIFHIN